LFFASNDKVLINTSKARIVATSLECFWQLQGFSTTVFFWQMPIISETSKRDEKGETHFFRTT
jgi:hypothetical protein